MRLVLRRAAGARTLLLAAAITATLTTGLLTAFLQFAQLLPTAGARAAVAAASAQERTLFVTMSAGSSPADVDKRDAAVRAIFADGLGGLPVTVAGAGYAIGQRLPDSFGDTVPGVDGTYAVVAYLDALPEHADLVSGNWPAPVTAGQPAQAALPEAVARTFGVAVGDQIPITDQRTKKAAPLVVSGVFRPRQPEDGYWRLASAPVEAGGYGPVVVDRDEFLARYQALSTLNWVAAPSAAELVGARLTAVADDATYVRTARSQSLGLDGGARVFTNLDELASRMATAELVTRSGLLLPALLLVLIAGYALWLVARLLAEQRRGENSLLRARGAARGQLARLATGEALLVVVPAAVFGAPLAAEAVRRVDRWVAGRGLDLSTVDFSRYGTTQGWIISGATALACAVAFVLPAAGQGRTWVAEQQERSRPTRWMVAQRAGVDLALVLLALLAWSQLRQYGGPLSGPADTLGIDPLLVTAPAIGVLAATAVSLRLLPVATRGGVRLAERRRSFAGLLGVWQADRRPHAGPVLLLVLAVAVAALAGCVAATWQQSQRDQAAHQAGADLRLTTATGAVTPPTVTELAALPSVDSVMRVERATVQPASDVPATLLAVDTPEAAGVVRLRPDLAAPSGAALFDKLATSRRTVPGAALPPGSQRLSGELRFDVTKESGTIAIGEVGSDSVTISVDDGSGLLHRIQLGVPRPNQPLPFDIPLPVVGPGPVVLIGMTGGATLPFDIFFQPSEVTFLGTTAWTLADLKAVDGQGQTTDLAAPTGWSVATTAGRDQPIGLATVTSRASAVGVRYPVDFRSFSTATNSWTFRTADTTEAGKPVPALVTPDVLAAAGVEVGETAKLSGLGAAPPVEVEIVGQLGAMPTADGQGGVLVDLVTYAAYRFAANQPDATPHEWWLATRPGEHAVAATAAAGRNGLVVTDREALTRRLLGDPLGTGVLLTLYAAALAATALAGFGLAVDARATALRRTSEMAVLHTLGAAPNALARAFVVEQTLLAGLGVLSGLLVGTAVAAAMAPALVLTAAATAPSPPALLVIPPAEVGLPALALLGVALLLGAAVAWRTRRDVVAGLLRMGSDQ